MGRADADPRLGSSIYRSKGLGTPAKRMGIDRNMTAPQVQALLDAAKADTSANGLRAYPLFTILANFGPRISEALDLTAEDFRNLASESFFDIRRKKKRGKTDMNFMWVNGEERQVLRQMILPRLPKTGTLFGFGVRTAQCLFGHFLQLAELRMVFSPHALRRFVAGQMAGAGIPEWIISLRLGHTLDTTQGYIANPTAEVVLPELEKKPVIY